MGERLRLPSFGPQPAFAGAGDVGRTFSAADTAGSRSGAAVSHTGHGETLEVTYGVGETRRLSFRPGEWMVHDLVNVGAAELIFTTVEYLGSANQALPLGAESAAA